MSAITVNASRHGGRSRAASQDGARRIQAGGDAAPREPKDTPEPKRTVSMDFCSSDADLILRCRDPEHVDFYVFKRILIEGSAVFRDMLKSPDSAGSLLKATPTTRVVELTESPEVVDHLLRLLYPVRKPDFGSLHELILVIKAAEKFQMEGVLYQLRELLVSPKFLYESPARVYAVACMFSWEAEAKAASRAALSVDVLHCEPFPELGDISARAFLRLLQMHQTRGQLAMQLLNNFSPTCTGTPGSACSSAAPLWWTDFKNRAREELRTSPTTARIFKASFLARCVSDTLAKCSNCGASYLSSATQARLQQLKEMIDALPDTI